MRDPVTRLPDSISTGSDDRLLRGLYKAFDEDSEQPSDNLPAWGDTYALPWCLVIHEQLAAVQRLALELGKVKVEVAEDCRLGVGEGDSFWTEGDGFVDKVCEGLAPLSAEQREYFAKLCYATPEKQRWLLGLVLP
jgi:hypothetical protein